VLSVVLPASHALTGAHPARLEVHGVYVPELRLPPGATVSLVVRAGDGFTLTTLPRTTCVEIRANVGVHR
jgi:hypothetical protein